MEDINQTLDGAIKARDIKDIRNILTTSMLQDPGFNKGVFEERLKRCFAAGISDADIFVPFEGEPLNSNQNTWTKDYYVEQRTEFRYNFSKERLEHLRKVGGRLYQPAETPASSYQEEAKKKYGDRDGYPSGQTTRRSPESPGDGFPKWLIPAGIGALLLLWLLFRKK
jgi:hypothetical protein